MRIHLIPPSNYHALNRVYAALLQYAPGWVTFTGPAEAELTIIPVIGRLDAVTIEASRCKDYALIQYCLRSTQQPHTSAWVDLWQRARLVWSYYDLPALCDEDEISHAGFNFYHAPLGVDPVFRQTTTDKDYTILTSGLSYLSESVRECILAARANSGRVFHLGPKLKQAPDMVYGSGLSDEELAAVYSRCAWVAGLRRKEGFELPAAEGLICGARPVMFDAPHYRRWFDGLAVFIEESDRAGVVEQLIELFRQGAKPVTMGEITLARARFDWARIIGGFYESLCDQ